jgi:hypothetical protein
MAELTDDELDDCEDALTDMLSGELSIDLADGEGFLRRYVPALIAEVRRLRTARTASGQVEGNAEGVQDG